MSKRILSMVLMLTLVLGSFSMAFADTANTSTALTPEQKIAELQRLGFIVGDDSGDLKLEDPIKRSETAIIVSKAVVSGGNADMDAVEKEIELSRYQSRFTDVPTSYRSNPYINVAVQKGIVSGYPDNTFKPARDIKYSEVITMMVGILGEKPTPGIRYPDNYIGKARELGLLEGINVNYVGQAQRQGVFELLYNTLTNNKVGNYNIDKVLVLENNRLESIDADQIVVEVIKEVQRANFAGDSRTGNAEERRGDQLRITLPKDADFDAEDLVGKVVDLSYDLKNEAVRAQEDKTYDYKVGEIELKEKDVVVDGKTYTVLKDERYKGDDERIFRTYINNESFKYENAYTSTYNKDNKVAKLDFGRVTIKNGKVLFIDAFAFDDIAPVKEVEEKDKKTEVTVYNDINDGGIKKIELEKQKVISVDGKGKFARINKSDIAKLDVIHVSADKNDNVKAVVVRQDAQVNGDYKKVVEYKDKTVVVIDGEEYKILTTPAKMPVYAYDSKEFRKLEADKASSVLKEFINEKSTALLDVNGDLQYLGSEIEFGEFVSLVDRIVGKEARLLKNDDSKSDYSTTLDSKLGDKSTGHQSLQTYDKGDLVFVAADKENIDTMKLLSKYDEIGTKVSKVDGDLRFIKTAEGDFRTFDRTNVFVRTLDSKGNVDKMYATTLKSVEKNFKEGATAVVITDAEYNKLDPRRSFDKDSKASESIANTIVFTVDFKSDLDREVVELLNVSNRYEEIEVKFDNGTKKTYKVEKDSAAYDKLKANVVAGDIIELGITKDEDKIVKEIDRLIAKNATGSVITDYNDRSKVITIGTEEYYLTKDTADFVKGGIEKGKLVAVEVEKGTKYVKAIASREGIATEAGTITKKSVADKLILVDGKVLMLDAKSVLKAEDKSVLRIGQTDIIDYLVEGDVLLNIDTNKDGLVTEMKLKNRGTAAEQDLAKAKEDVTNRNLVEADYTVASYKALTDALALPETTQEEIGTKAEAIKSALAGLVKSDTNPPVGETIKGQFQLSPFNSKYVEFLMPVGQTELTSAKLNGVSRPTDKFSTDTNVDGKLVGKVIIEDLTNDVVTVLIGGTEYTIVK